LMQGGVYYLSWHGVGEKISQQESNRQSLLLKVGTSPLSPGSLGSSLIDTHHQ
jgi:hypothetical protein